MENSKTWAIKEEEGKFWLKLLKKKGIKGELIWNVRKNKN
jgi:hypothetical protein